ncbi:hypothetical protein JCM16303_005604 [Sporobolomyces ruberrimus]
MSTLTGTQKASADEFFSAWEKVDHESRAERQHSLPVELNVGYETTVDAVSAKIRALPYGSQGFAPHTFEDEIEALRYHAEVEVDRFEEGRMNVAECQELVRNYKEVLATRTGQRWLENARQKEVIVQKWTKQHTRFHWTYVEQLKDALDRDEIGLAQYLNSQAQLCGLRSYWTRLGGACHALDSLFDPNGRDYDRYRYISKFRVSLLRFAHPSDNRYDAEAKGRNLKLQILAISESGHKLLKAWARIRLIIETAPPALGDNYDYANLPRSLHTFPLRLAIERVARTTELLKFWN